MADPGTSTPRHGGDLAHATAEFGAPAGGWLDLSTGINPNPYPAPALARDDIARLPDSDALARLIEAARNAYGVPAGVKIIATPGSEIAIRLLPLVAPAGKVAIIGPTYGSHGEAWANTGRTGADVTAETIPDDAAVLVLANPNNPDGRILDVGRLAAFARRFGAGGGCTIVDEAFADLSPEASLAPRLAGLSAVVLRSFGKFYGLPGLRLGFVAGDANLLERLQALLGDWAVSGPAIAIGTAALIDTGWRGQMRRRLARDGKRLRAMLAGHGLRIVGGADLFVLAVDPGTMLHRRLAERGIWTRTFAGEPTWLRVGLPPDDEAFARLDEALAAVMVRAVAR